MSIKVTDFKWEKGKNDLEYIALLEKNLDAMAYKFRECAKIAKEQYSKGKKDGYNQALEDLINKVCSLRIYDDDLSITDLEEARNQLII